jgi:UDP-N-acetylmuramate-alanine ligase
VKERLQSAGTPGGVRLFTDSNVHPDALALALEALREHHPSGKLLCVVQPQHPGSARHHVQRRLPQVLGAADHVVITPVAGYAPEGVDAPFSCEQVVADLLKRNIDAAHCTTRKSIVSWIAERTRPGDTVLVAVHPPSRPLLRREISTALEQAAAHPVS